jgi:hypothetical protein
LLHSQRSSFPVHSLLGSCVVRTIQETSPAMREALKRIAHMLLVGAMCVSLGGHLVLVQTLAWGRMLMDHSRSGSLSEAASMTFDGEHPCHLCKVVKQTREKEKREEAVKTKDPSPVVLPVVVGLREPVGDLMVADLPPYSLACGLVASAADGLTHALAAEPWIYMRGIPAPTIGQPLCAKS